MSRKTTKKKIVHKGLGCPHTKSSLASSRQAGRRAVFGKHGNHMEWTHQQQAVEQAVAVHSSMQRLTSFAPNSCSNCCCVCAARRTPVHTQTLDGEVALWWTIMDVELLISEVFQCLAIWDSKERKHSDRLYNAKAWENIGIILGVEVTSAVLVTSPVLVTSGN